MLSTASHALDRSLEGKGGWDDLNAEAQRSPETQRDDEDGDVDR